MNKELNHLLEQGYSLLTPTMRLSRYLKNQFAEIQLASDKKVWESPDILPWHGWLYRFWDDYTAHSGIDSFRLSNWQRQNIWLQVIQNSDYNKDILQAHSVAKRAVQAWDLTHQWQIPLFPDDIYISHDVRAFQSWANAFLQLCQSKNWIDDALLLNVLSEHLHVQTQKSKQKIALIGFEDIHPQQQSFLDALTDSGSELKIVSLEKRQQYLCSVGFIDVYDEIDAAAHWIRELLESNTGETIGIVIPELHSLRTQIQNQFDDILLTDGILSNSEPSNRPYSISLGESLSNYPVITTAFSILNLVDQPLSVEDLGMLLRSPFIQGAAEERIKRALLDASLRDFGEQNFSVNSLKYNINKGPEKDRCEIFLECIFQWQGEYYELPKTQSARDWAQCFSKLLSIFAWPGERSLNSAEYQTTQAWQELLERFVSLDIVNSSLSYRAALAQLRQLAGTFSFQPETPEVPVQVMGVAGAAAMHFDHLWIMGLHEEVWPGPAEPNPFIPIRLQEQYQLPNGSAEGRLTYIKHMTECLINSSTDVVTSYPQNEKERALRPSPLIKPHIQKSTDLDIQQLPAYKKLVFESSQFEFNQDDVAPVIVPGQRVSGGTGLFKDQAACPFRAFARHRLNARGLSELDIGLDAMERGSLLHDVMQDLWQKVSGYSALMALTAAQEESLVSSSIDKVIRSYTKLRPLTFTDQFILLEKQRLNSLIHEWLILEKQRQPFDVVACEKKHNFNFNDIEVHTRIDRVDKLDDGRHVIIDYKTGEVNASAWFDDRPEDPQLPLYAITTKAALAAILFARIRRGESMFVGVADGEGIAPAVKNYEDTPYLDEHGNWSDLLEAWSEVMSNIANDFRMGDARVEPKNSTTCRYCDIHAFCRIHEKNDAIKSRIEKSD